MPTDTPDQQITLPVDADSADNPVAFNQAVGDIEPRLVREYTTEADRTARMLTLAANDISSLSAPATGPARLEAYDGAAHISLFTRAVYAAVRTTATQNVGPSNTTLQNVTSMVAALPTAGTFQWEAVVFYNSGTTADIKFAYTMPAGATMRWGMTGLASGAAAVTGDVNLATQTATATATTIGGAGADVMCTMKGEITMGGTAGNLQLQAAQGTSDATATNIYARSRMIVWRVL